MESKPVKEEEKEQGQKQTRLTPTPPGQTQPEPTKQETYLVVGVRFKKAGRIYHFAPGWLTLAPGDKVIVETARGQEYGEVVAGPKEIPAAELSLPLKPVVRKATRADEERIAAHNQKTAEAFRLAQERVAAYGLPMKLVDVEYSFDGSKFIFYFSAAGRVDFRELVRDLAARLHCRIELRQIGVRDQAKMLGGLGCCGRPLCCATFLGDFEPVSIRMAKDQNLSLNPLKISGICGRLLCCLKFEDEYYRECLAEGRCPVKEEKEEVTEEAAESATETNEISIKEERNGGDKPALAAEGLVVRPGADGSKEEDDVTPKEGAGERRTPPVKTAGPGKPKPRRHRRHGRSGAALPQAGQRRGEVRAPQPSEQGRGSRQEGGPSPFRKIRRRPRGGPGSGGGGVHDRT